MFRLVVCKCSAWSIFDDTDVTLGFYFECTYCKLLWIKHIVICNLFSCTPLFKDSPEFDLVFDNTVDHWVASSSAEKCIFVQILYHACQAYREGRAGKLGKIGRQKKESQHAHYEVGPGPGDSTAASASRTLQARRKSYVPLRQAEFINCQSKLTGGTST